VRITVEYKLTSKSYYEALKQDKLLGLRCRACNAVTVPPAMVCRGCTGQNLEIVGLRGSGRIRSFTTVYVAPEGRESEVPYIIVLVELDEGPWLMGNLTGIDPATVSMALIGKEVKMGHKVFTGDKYSAGEGVSPLFSLVG
jgi:uncharacterized OB-fold protein